MTAHTASEFGGLLRRHRLAAGLTQEELAEVAGVSARSIGDLERGLQRTPYPATIRRLADALNLDAESRALFLDAAIRTPATGTRAETEVSQSEGTVSAPKGMRYRFLRYWWLAGLIAATAVLASAALIVFGLRSGGHSAQFGTFVQTVAIPRASVAGRPTSMVVAPDGTLYVLDRAASTIRVYSSTGRLLRGWGSAGSQPGQMWRPRALALGPANEVYVADTGNGRMEKFSSSGRLLAVWGDQYGAPGTFRPVGIAVDEAGIVYVADSAHFRVLRLDATGHMLDTLAPPNVSFPLAIPVLSSVSIGPTGRIYVADERNDVIFVYEAGGVPPSTLLYVPARPTAVAADRRGDMFVAYASSGMIQELSPTGARLHMWRGNRIRSPSGIALGKGGEPYVADPGSGDVSRLIRGRWTPLVRPGPQSGGPAIAERIAAGPRGSIAVASASEARITWIPGGSGRRPDIVLGGSKLARFVGPIGGLAVATDGALYVTDYGGGDVLKLTSDGQVAGSWGSSPPAMAHPEGVAVDRAGNVYVADQGNGRVQEFAADGRLLNLFPVPQASSADLVAPSPYGVAVDTAGDLYVTDEINDHVTKLDRNDRVLFQWGSRGSGPSGLRAPQGIAIDEKRERIYVADNGNNRIQILSTTGALLGAVSADRPEDLAVDAPTGHVYVLDAGGQRLQILAP